MVSSSVVSSKKPPSIASAEDCNTSSDEIVPVSDLTKPCFFKFSKSCFRTDISSFKENNSSAILFKIGESFGSELPDSLIWFSVML